MYTTRPTHDPLATLTESGAHAFALWLDEIVVELADRGGLSIPAAAGIVAGHRIGPSAAFVLTTAEAVDMILTRYLSALQ